MTRVVQIVAEFAGDGKSPADRRYRLTFHGAVDERGRLVRRRFYGAVDEPEIGEFPFVLEPPTEGRSHGRLGWGWAYKPEVINVFGKSLALNEQFTRWVGIYGDAVDKGPIRIEEWTYRIVMLNDLGTPQ